MRKFKDNSEKNETEEKYRKENRNLPSVLDICFIGSGRAKP